jgi:CheY-like chemotaxis protein
MRKRDVGAEAIRILMADDDPDDRLMAKEALEEARLINHFDTVDDGEQLMDYLHRRGDYEYLADQPLPGLILLDLNMPRKDGREALKAIKADPGLRRIPIVVLTTSKEDEDVARTYDLGVNSFIVKPVTFQGLVDVMKILAKYWFQIVRLPADV